MIELRWLDRMIVRDPKISHYYGPDRETVLQFREHVVGYGWSDWQDIPVVRKP